MIQAYYIAYILGYDILHEYIETSAIPECDTSFDFCFDVATEFMKSEEYLDMRISLYEGLDRWVCDNETKIREIMEMHSNGEEQRV